MIEIDFDDVSLSPATLARWQHECSTAIATLRAAGVDVAHTTETAYVLDDGRLRLILDLGQSFSVTVHADPGEWRRVSEN